jgi:hypothetical protein
VGIAAFWESREAIARERGGHLVRVHGSAEWSDCAGDSGVAMAIVTRWSLANEVNQLRRRQIVTLDHGIASLKAIAVSG